MNIPKAFISYSHDSQKHKKWVLDLATRLRNTGIDAIIDQWELGPGDDLPNFMEKNLARCDYVLMICTDRYVEKANGGVGGVGYEKMIITSELMKRIDNNKIIPIIRQEGTRNVPTFLKTKIFLDFSKSDEYEFNFDELIRRLHNAPLYVKPKIGNNPFESIEGIRPEVTGDALKKLMTIVTQSFERGHDYTNYSNILSLMGIGRIMVDMLIDDAKRKGLVTQDTDRDLRITNKGKFYAIDHKIVPVK